MPMKDDDTTRCYAMLSMMMMNDGLFDDHDDDHDE